MEGKNNNMKKNPLTRTAEDHGNPRGMPPDVYGLVLFGEGLWFKEPILTGQTEHRILLARPMNPVSSNLNYFTPLVINKQIHT